MADVISTAREAIEAAAKVADDALHANTFSHDNFRLGKREAARVIAAAIRALPIADPPADVEGGARELLAQQWRQRFYSLRRGTEGDRRKADYLSAALRSRLSQKRFPANSLALSSWNQTTNLDNDSQLSHIGRGGHAPELPRVAFAAAASLAAWIRGRGPANPRSFPSRTLVVHRRAVTCRSAARG